jgi:hypothetical protein
MQLKTSAFQLSIVWITASLLTACGPSVTCDNPLTADTEYCGSLADQGQTSTTGSATHTGGAHFIYYRSYNSSYYTSNPARTNSLRSTGRGGSSRSGFGSTGSGRSGFG